MKTWCCCFKGKKGFQVKKKSKHFCQWYCNIVRCQSDGKFRSITESNQCCTSFRLLLYSDTMAVRDKTKINYGEKFLLFGWKLSYWFLVIWSTFHGWYIALHYNCIKSTLWGPRFNQFSVLLIFEIFCLKSKETYLWHVLNALLLE